MKKCSNLTKTVLGTFLVTLFNLNINAQHTIPSIGGYNVYYGHLHNHTSYSDGTGTPAQAYAAALSAELDFFGLADHSDAHGAIISSEWTDIKNQADTYNSDGTFTTFYGFEWSADANLNGHVAVINNGVDNVNFTNDVTTVAATGTFGALVTWLSSRNLVAFFNHPSFQDNSGTNSYTSTSQAVSPKFVGMELWNAKQGTVISDYLPYYNSALANTNHWIIGATGSADNHTSTWGTVTNYRMAILANGLTRADLFAAMKARRFYSTLDKNLALSFKINGQEMGSSLSMPAPSLYTTYYSIYVEANDLDVETFTNFIIYKYTKLTGLLSEYYNSNTISTTHITYSGVSIIPAAGDYYYVKVTEADGNVALSSPIFISSMAPGINHGYVMCGGNCATISGSATGGTGPYTYLWSTGATSSTITVCPTTSTTYYVTTTDVFGTKTVNSPSVIVSIVTANAGSDQTINSGGSATLTASGGTYYAWSTGATTASITVSPTVTTTYTVTVSSRMGCSDTDDVVVTVVSKNNTSKVIDSQSVSDNLKYFIVYPNPSSSEVSFNFNSETETAYIVKVIDVNGREVMNYNFYSIVGLNTQMIDINSLNNGLYLLKIEGVGDIKKSYFIKRE